MTPHALQWTWPLLFFLIGSIPTGYLMGKSRGIDVRQHGSGNIGATNVWRVMGRNWGMAAFTCDFLKGFLPLYIFRDFYFSQRVSWSGELLLVLCGLAVILGHNYTPWLGFKGGKGVASSAGMLGALLPFSFVSVVTAWILGVLLTRTISIGSLLAATTLPLATAFFYPGQWVYFGLAAVVGSLVAWGHRSNLKRLLAGTEPRVGAAKKVAK